MTLSRRRFIRNASAIPVVGLGVSGLSLGSRSSAALAGLEYRGENLYLAFNAIREVEAGESDEYTTIANIERILTELGVPSGTQIIGIGARSGTASDPFGKPGEMGYLWEFGSPWRGGVTSTVDASFVPLAKDDPIIVTQVGVLTPSSGHHFRYDNPDLRGSVLWTLFEDETVRPAYQIGFHNAFKDLDGGLTETIYHCSRAALKNPANWARPRDRAKLEKFMPDLRDDKVWSCFSQTLGEPFLIKHWQKYIKEQGWDGAGVVIQGEMANVLQFHLREWNQKSPNEPSFEIGQGTHPPLNIRHGREIRQFITKEPSHWSMVGFIWNMESSQASPPMHEWMRFSDLFGQPFHIHGFRSDGLIGGHTLMPLLSAGVLTVSLYPLSFKENETAFRLNNDLLMRRETLLVTEDLVQVDVQNHGDNFARNVVCSLRDRRGRGQSITLNVLNPHEIRNLRFARPERSGTYVLSIDSPKNFFEGGEGRKNNEFLIQV
jgi:hypothetical protein